MTPDYCKMGGVDEQTETKAQPTGLRRWLRASRVALLVFCVTLVVYLVVFALTIKLSDAPRTDGDEPHFLIVTQSLLRDGDLHIEDEYADQLNVKAGYYPRPMLPHVVEGAHGRHVFGGSVLPSVVVLPGFAIAGYKGAAGTMILITALTALLTFLIIRRFMSERLAAAVTLFFFLSYPIVAYSRRIYPEVMVMFLLALGTWLGLRIREGGRWPYFLAAGLVCGAIPWLHPKFIMLSLALTYLVVVCAWKQYRNWAVFLVPFAAGVVALLLWTRYLYGPDIINGLTIARGGGGFLGKDSPWGVVGLFVDRGWGLLPYAPPYLIFFAGLAFPRKLADLRKWWVFVPLTILLHVLVVGSFGGWLGGAAPVPRYLMPVMPLLVLCCAVVIKEVRGRWPWIVMGVLAVLQVLFTVLALIDPVASYPLVTNFAGKTHYNELYLRFFGKGFAESLPRVFPIFHPSISVNNLLVLAAWVVFVVVFAWLLRRTMLHKPEQVLDGGLLSHGSLVEPAPAGA